jgi:hypothetical protein
MLLPLPQAMSDSMAAVTGFGSGSGVQQSSSSSCVGVAGISRVSRGAAPPRPPCAPG